MINTSPRLLQWNARGLTRAKLEEFRYNLHLLHPSFVFLSETHWCDSFVSFKSFTCLTKNRPPGQRGGVALLISKQFSFVHIAFPLFANLEVIGATVIFNGSSLDLVSVYCPRGNFEVAEIRSLFGCLHNDAIVGGDFNAHHPLWGFSPQSNKAGRSLSDFLDDSNFLLCTQPRLETRLAPGSATPSTLDLTIASPNIASKLTISIGSDWGSDHVPCYCSSTQCRPIR